MTEKREPYKRHNETPLTTLTRLVDHYERTSKLLPSLNLDSQIINQSSQAIQSPLESLDTPFPLDKYSQVIRLYKLFQFWNSFDFLALFLFCTHSTGKGFTLLQSSMARSKFSFIYDTI